MWRIVDEPLTGGTHAIKWDCRGAGSLVLVIVDNDQRRVVFRWRITEWTTIKFMFNLFFQKHYYFGQFCYHNFLILTYFYNFWLIFLVKKINYFFKEQILIFYSTFTNCGCNCNFRTFYLLSIIFLLYIWTYAHPRVTAIGQLLLS